MFNRRALVLFFLFSALLFSGAVRASESTEPRLHLSIAEQLEIDQDKIQAIFVIEAENRSVETLQGRINSEMEEALKLAKSYDGVRTRTETSHVSKTDPDSAIWRGWQSLVLESVDSVALFQLAGKLQERGLEMRELSYSLSEEAWYAARESLTEHIVTRLRSRTQQFSEALGYSGYRFIEIKTNDGRSSERQGMMKMSGAEIFSRGKKMSAPLAGPGVEKISLMLNAEVVLTD